jgi:nucleoside-diphosphate-sugar epimerase/predicted dehydrogenase
MAADSSPRLAIIGCGTVAEFLSLALHRIGWLPSALIDSSSQRIDVIARKVGRKAGVIKSSNWPSVANEFDAALVTLPYALHGPIGAALVKAGKHVFTEAPLAMTGDDCRAMIAAAHASGVILSVGLFRRYLLVARWTKALLQSETLGEITHFNLREGTVFRSNSSFDLLFQPNLAGGGLLTDTGVHTLDLLLWWLGEVRSFNYWDDSEGGFEADCILECELKSGASGRIELSRTRNLRNSVRIEGTRGFVEIHLYKNEVLTGSPNALAFRHDGISPYEIRPQFVAELFDIALKDFRKSISRGEQADILSRDATESVKLIERCYATRQQLVQPWVKVAPASPSDSDVPLLTLPRGSKVLVTGATGFIGTRLVERLIHEHGTQVRCIIRDIGRASRVARLSAELLHGDLSNAGEIDRAVDGVDYVFHCAYDVQSRRQNIEGLRNLIEACASHSVHRLVYVSSCAVYEPFADGPLTEQTPDGDRSNVYVDTKLSLERMIFEAVRNGGVAATIVQPAIVYGPFCSPWTNTPAEMLIFGDVILPDRGEGLCNAVYIDDVVDGLILAALSPAAVGERFIISGPQPVTWATFYTEMGRALRTQLPKFWPYDRIADANHGAIQSIRLTVSDPKRLIKMVLRWKQVRQVLQAGLDAMPSQLRMLMMRYYFGSDERRAGETFLPSRPALALYRSKAIATSEKARSKLGYRPRFDFRRGMALTGRYLEWAYGDLRETNAPKTQRQPAAVDISNAR